MAVAAPSAVTTRKSSPPKVISRTLRIVALSSTASRVLGTWLLRSAKNTRCFHPIVRTVSFQCQAKGPLSNVRSPRRARARAPWPAGGRARSRRRGARALRRHSAHMLRPGARIAPMAQTRLVPAALEGPVDRVVRSLFGTSWGKARGWIEAGKVRVGGALVTDTTARVVAGAEIAVDESARKPRPEELGDGDVVYSDAQVIVVAKPPGLSTIPYDDTETDTLDARVRAWLERKRLVPRGQRPTLGIVHRLDKETSGLVVFTRTWLAKQALTSQFRQHTVHRRYLAIAHGDVPGRTLRSFFIENRGDGLRGSKRGRPAGSKPLADGREAITHVTRVEALAGSTLVACRLETGRTHQIRI